MIPEESQFLVEQHKKFLKSCLNVFPDAYVTLDTNRLTLLFFVLAGLDVLGALDEVDEHKRRAIIDWIYTLQITTKDARTIKDCGFRGSLTNCASGSKSHTLDTGHIASTYSGLACLVILQDDLSRLDRLGILASIRTCQKADGSFQCTPHDNERDMRFVYCAVAISFMLQDFRAIDLSRLLLFIQSSQNYDGGFGQGPGLESHGGSTYCAVATLDLLNRLHGSSDLLTAVQRRRLLRWCLWRQREGFHGRPDKPDDSCYSFWMGATLEILESSDLVDRTKATQFTLRTQDDVIGGFAKEESGLPDVLHTYLSLAGLSLLGLPGLEPVHPSLNVTKRAAGHLLSVQNNWNSASLKLEEIPCCKEA